MTFRVTDSQSVRGLLTGVQRQRVLIDKLGQDISSGYKVRNPGDSSDAATIAQFHQTLERYEGYKNRIAAVQSYLVFQDDALKDVNEVLTRARELATQGANEPNGVEVRLEMAEEVWELRDHLISIANTKYQGKYVYNGTVDDQVPFTPLTYTVPASGSASQRYVYDIGNNSGTQENKTVQISDDLNIVINTPGDGVFEDAIAALERLGRALSGYRTTPATGIPDGGGTAYTFPDDLEEQTADIQATIDMIDAANALVEIERVDLGGRMRRIETAESVMELHETTAIEALSKLQFTDMAEAATQLSQAQYALEASLTVSAKILNQSLLDFI